MSAFAKLSDTLELTDNFDESIEMAYKYFAEKINNKEKRPVLFDKEVFVEAGEWPAGKPVGFWHIVSLEETHKFKVLPCVNDIASELCDENCEKKYHRINIKYDTETRELCLLRASRLPWILDLFRLANRDDPSVTVWIKPDKKVYLRYNHYGIDYVIILSETKHYYRIITAFPVFYTKDKKGFAKDSMEFSWSYFRKEKRSS